MPDTPVGMETETAKATPDGNDTKAQEENEQTQIGKADEQD